MPMNRKAQQGTGEVQTRTSRQKQNPLKFT